jgi:glycolate oxidase
MSPATDLSGLTDRLASIVGDAHLVTGDALAEVPEYGHDESLHTEGVMPAAVVLPATTSEVAAIVRLAAEVGVPLTARGTGSGLSGACIPSVGGIVVAFSRMSRILEIDTANQVAVVQPGVQLDQLDEALRPEGLVYTVYPGEQSATLGGNVATNAGGMRAVRYGVTRHNVLGLEVVTGDGEVIRTGGKFVKSSSGYDLTQLIIGSEGTLALVTEVTVKLQPVAAHGSTVVAPFASLAEVTGVIPSILRAGLTPTILEYIDSISLQSIMSSESLDLGIPEELRQRSSAYLVVVIEHRIAERVDEDLATLSDLLEAGGALDLFVLPGPAATGLIRARERAFYVAKAAGADDLVDMVVPRAALPVFLDLVGKLAADYGAFAVGCGHAGDGNVHLSVFQPDETQRSAFLTELFRAGIGLGGAISGEHGIGTAKRRAFNELEPPARLALMRKIKAVFDPAGILNPGKVFDPTAE